MSSILSSLKSLISEWREKRKQAAIRREEERKRLEEIRRREEEHRRAMYRKGNEFEEYVRNMFPEEKFELIHRTPTDEDTGGRYVHSMIYPDLRFRERSTGRRFWVEVKFRSRTEQDGSIIWCTDNQLTNYKRAMFDTREKVFIMIGIGGTVQNPSKVYCLNLEDINFTTLFYRTYKDHRIMFGTVESFRQLCYIATKEQYRCVFDSISEGPIFPLHS